MYETLRQHPELFQALTGLTISAFDALHDDIEPLWQEADRSAKLSGLRLRRVGGGRKYGVGFRDRLLMACLCERRLLPTSEIAALYGIHPSTVSRYQQGLRLLIYKREPRCQVGETACVKLTEVMETYPELAELVQIE